MGNAFVYGQGGTGSGVFPKWTHVTEATVTLSTVTNQITVNTGDITQELQPEAMCALHVTFDATIRDVPVFGYTDVYFFVAGDSGQRIIIESASMAVWKQDTLTPRQVPFGRLNCALTQSFPANVEISILNASGLTVFTSTPATTAVYKIEPAQT